MSFCVPSLVTSACFFARLAIALGVLDPDPGVDVEPPGVVLLLLPPPPPPPGSAMIDYVSHEESLEARSEDFLSNGIEFYSQSVQRSEIGEWPPVRAI